MKRKIKIWLLSIVLIAVVLNLGMYIEIKVEQYQAKNLYGQVRNRDKLYVYETYSGVLNPALYVKDLKDTAELISYYSKVEKNDTSAFFNFEIKMMRITMHEPMYVYSYQKKGSKIVQTVDFDVHCWGYVKGYLYKPTTHRYAPPDSLIKKEEAFIVRHNQDKRVQMLNRIAKKISDYGWYCND
jgi:hypothetical protein